MEPGWPHLLTVSLKQVRNMRPNNVSVFRHASFSLLNPLNPLAEQKARGSASSVAGQLNPSLSGCAATHVQGMDGESPLLNT